MKKFFLRLLPLTGLLLAACNSSNQTHAPENGPTEEHQIYTSGFSQDNDYDSYPEYEETYEDENNETSDSDVAGFDFLTKLFYYGKDVEESEKEELNALADKFIKEEFQRSQYLITNNSAGYFRINGIVSEINNKYYQLGYHVGGINMVDAATVAGSFLDKDYDNVDEKIEGCMMPYPDENAIISFENKYYRPDEDGNPSDEELKKNTNIYHIQCENSDSWYYKDSIDAIVIRSELFKTKEGIGVGSTFEELKEAYGVLLLHIGWIESDERVQVRATQYPMVRFIFMEEDVTVFAPDKEEDDAEYRESGFNGCRKEDGSGLKPNSKIWRIIIDPHFVTCPECL